MTIAILLTFLAGFTIECACVFWVHFSERGAAARTAFFSMCIGSAQVLGIGESIHDPKAGVAFVLGYGVGTYVTVRFVKRSLPKAPTDP